MRIQDLTNKIISLIGKKDVAVRDHVKVVGDTLQSNIDRVEKLADTNKSNILEVSGIANGNAALTSNNAAGIAQNAQDIATNATNIATEKGRIDAILQAANADADSFKEIVELITSVDKENDNVFAGYKLANDARVKATETDLSEYKNSNDERVKAIEDDLSAAIEAIDLALGPN